MISLYGPLNQVCGMGSKAKHQYFKNVAARIKTKKNAHKPLVKHHQLLQRYKHSELFLAEAATMTGTKLTSNS